jgi:hypothetical protein
MIQYPRPLLYRTSSDYWMPAFAGMTVDGLVEHAVAKS